MTIGLFLVMRRQGDRQDWNIAVKTSAHYAIYDSGCNEIVSINAAVDNKTSSHSCGIFT